MLRKLLKFTCHDINWLIENSVRVLSSYILNIDTTLTRCNNYRTLFEIFLKIINQIMNAVQ